MDHIDPGWVAFWPAAISRHASDVDLMLAGLVALCVALTAPVFVLMVWFAHKYRSGVDVDRSGGPKRNLRLETAWAAIPFVLVLFFYVWAARAYWDLHEPPADALEISVIAKQWMWKFQHPGGQREINELHVPLGRAVKLSMTSQDVIHSLFFPSLRIKQDVLPERVSYEWFEADQPGVHHLFCAEFCGTSHSKMRGRIVVLEPEAYADWLAANEADLTLARRGAALFRSYGCSGCHMNSDVVRAPPLYGVYGRPVPLASGGFVTADEQYVRDSILMPLDKVVAGYRPIMPSFAGRIAEEDLVQLVAYVKSLATADDYRLPDTP